MKGKTIDGADITWPPPTGSNIEVVIGKRYTWRLVKSTDTGKPLYWARSTNKRKPKDE